MEYSILNNLLTFWEDINLITDLQYQINRINNITGLQPLPESEINKDFILVRKIKNYQNLRTLFEASNPRGFTENSILPFLPRIPTSMKTQFKDGPISMALESMYSSFMIPIVLTNWLIDKKVCLIQNSSMVKEVNPSNENYLNKLPYNSFLLDIGESIHCTFEVSKRRGDTSYRHFLLNRTENSIGVFGIPENISDFLETDGDREIVKKVIQEASSIDSTSDFFEKVKSKKAQKKAAKKTGHKIKEFNDLLESRQKIHGPRNVMPMLFPFLSVIDIDSGMFSFHGIHILNLQETLTMAHPVFDKLLSVINGFCKLLFEHETPEIPFVDIVGTDTGEKKSDDLHVIELQTQNLKWYEVPINNIDFMKLHKSKGKLVVSITRGGEKSPHQRRGHVRIYRNDDGSEKKRIYLKTLIVRKDKLLKGTQGKSGVTKL